ncbi:MAG TPA: lactate/malate dehydrogenase family protein [Fimbriimonadales bacterium]|nr:lactate/malate dehydrogenase family protein [Fimbriimonadales bacterium]
MKVSIIGGGGRVGSNAAFALLLGNIVKEIVIHDMNEEMAQGEALDLLHGTAFASPQRIYAGGYDAVKDSDCVIITAGLRRRPDESRLELINRNVQLFRDILKNLKGISLPAHAKILVVSNPVDILTHIAVRESGLPVNQVFGLGTVLDTCRFRSLLAEHFKVAATDIKAMILGEHGDTMVPIWSSATINGIPLRSLPGFSQEIANEIFEATKKSGAEVIRLKGGAGWAVGISIKTVVEAIALNRESVLPVSCLQTGALGIRDVCLSLPTIVGEKGVHSILEPDLDKQELDGLYKSEAALKEVWQKVA